MEADAMPLNQIAKTITEEKVLVPSTYWEQKERMVSCNHMYHDSYT